MFPFDTKILIIDDSQTTRLLLRAILTELGFKNIVEADDGKKAIEVLQLTHHEDPIRLVFSDIKMPRMDGLQVLNYVRKAHFQNDIPFVVVTAEGETNSVMQALRSEASGYILKPFNKASIADRLKKVWYARTTSVGEAS